MVLQEDEKVGQIMGWPLAKQVDFTKPQKSPIVDGSLGEDGKEGSFTQSSCKATCSQMKALRNGDQVPGNEVNASSRCVLTETWNN